MNPNKIEICCSASKTDKARYCQIKRKLTYLISKGSLIHFKKGQVLFYEGHLPCGFYLLKKGEVSLFHTCTNGPSKEDSEQDRLLGLVHLLSNTPNCFTCRAEDNVQVIFFPKVLVLEFLGKKQAVNQ